MAIGAGTITSEAFNSALEVPSFIDECTTTDFIRPEASTLNTTTVKVLAYELDTLSDYDDIAGMTAEAGNGDYVEVALTQNKGIFKVLPGINAEMISAEMSGPVFDIFSANIKNSALALKKGKEVEFVKVLAADGIEDDDTDDLTNETVYEKFIEAGTTLTTNEVSRIGRYALVTPAVEGLLLLSPTFIKAGDKGQAVAENGLIGFCNGFSVFGTPYLPAQTEVVFGQKDCATVVHWSDIDPFVENLTGGGYVNSCAIKGHTKYGAAVKYAKGVFVKKTL